MVKCALGPKYPCWRSWLEEPQWRQPITDADGEGEGEGEKRGGDLVGHLLDRIIKDYSNSAVPHVPQVNIEVRDLFNYFPLLQGGRTFVTRYKVYICRNE